MTNNANYIEGLTQDFQRAAWGKALLSVREAAHVTGISETNILNAIKLGELKAARLKGKGSLHRITCRELARWVVELEKNSIPLPPDAA